MDGKSETQGGEVVNPISVGMNWLNNKTTAPVFGKEGNMFNHFYSRHNNICISDQRKNPFSEHTPIKGMLSLPRGVEYKPTANQTPKEKKAAIDALGDGQVHVKAQGTPSWDNAFSEIFSTKCLYLKSYF